MPTIYQLKPAFQGLLRPLVARLVRAGVTPNQVTVAALLLSAAVGATVAISRARWALLLLPPALLLRMALNALDGMMAREHDLRTPLGALLNEVGDLLADALLYLPFALLPGCNPVAVVVAVVLAGASELAGVAALEAGASRRYDGPLGKSDRAFVFGALGLALGLGLPAGPWLDLVLWLVVGLLVATIDNRVRQALREGQAAVAAAGASEPPPS
ncbi:MAG TPA: CDP-alcohol phosphatidyltransferase family protein [Thermoanaerobaculia bacterium]|jgi:CDP-diacylglycerol--glycerol-3-phosphate 3-phosphatidyltransferase|nr:CDP-alcohol phosphatidyltransferase family protein [Thermoanaerobaculia bacterium]